MPQSPHRQEFYPIQLLKCSRCGAVFANCRLEMLNPFITKSTLGLCCVCIFGESSSGIATMEITSRMKYEVAFSIGAACG
jgi:hypothetical protein